MQFIRDIKRDWEQADIVGKIVQAFFLVIVGGAICAFVGGIAFGIYKDSTTVSPREFAEQYVESNRPELTRRLTDAIVASDKLPAGVGGSDLESMLEHRATWTLSRRTGGVHNIPLDIETILLYADVHGPLDGTGQNLTASVEFRAFVADEETGPRLLTIEFVDDRLVYLEPVVAGGS